MLAAFNKALLPSPARRDPLPGWETRSLSAGSRAARRLRPSTTSLGVRTAKQDSRIRLRTTGTAAPPWGGNGTESRLSRPALCSSGSGTALSLSRFVAFAVAHDQVVFVFGLGLTRVRMLVHIVGDSADAIS